MEARAVWKPQGPDTWFGGDWEAAGIHFPARPWNHRGDGGQGA